MDVKTLYTFIAVVDHGSFAEAANALKMSISNISVQMRALEQDVGLLLFDRSRRPPVLTSEGYEFAEQARDVIKSWEQLSENLKRRGNAGVLKVGAVHTAVAGVVPPALLRLRQTVPELSIRLSTGLTHELEVALRAGRIDAAIVTEPEAMAPNMTFRAFCAEPLVVIAHEEATGGDFREILENNPYVRFSRMARVANLIEARLQELGIEVTSQMQVDSLEGVISLVGSGLGVSIVPYRRGGEPLGEQVKVYPLGMTPTYRRLGLLMNTHNARQRFADQLFDALSSEAHEAERVFEN